MKLLLCAGSSLPPKHSEVAVLCPVVTERKILPVAYTRMSNVMATSFYLNLFFMDLNEINFKMHFLKVAATSHVLRSHR